MRICLIVMLIVGCLVLNFCKRGESTWNKCIIDFVIVMMLVFAFGIATGFFLGDEEEAKIGISYLLPPIFSARLKSELKKWKVLKK